VQDSQGETGGQVLAIGDSAIGRGRCSDLTRATRDETSRDRVVPRRGLVAVEALEEPSGRRTANAGRVLGNDRDWRVQQIGKREIVKADQCDLSLRTDALQCANDTDGQ
jgi:serine/threonine protein phosphatase PrpC